MTSAAVLFVCTIHVFWVHQTGPSVSNLVMDTIVNEGSLNILNSFNFVSQNTSWHDNQLLFKIIMAFTPNCILKKSKKDYQDFVNSCGERTDERELIHIKDLLSPRKATIKQIQVFENENHAKWWHLSSPSQFTFAKSSDATINTSLENWSFTPFSPKVWSVK